MGIIDYGYYMIGFTPYNEHKQTVHISHNLWADTHIKSFVLVILPNLIPSLLRPISKLRTRDKKFWDSEKMKHFKQVTTLGRITMRILDR